jgi:hypothetical protein
MLSELEPSLARDNAAAIEHFGAHRGLRVATLGAQAVTLGHQLESFDFPAALATLREALAAYVDKAQPGGRRFGPGAAGQGVEDEAVSRGSQDSAA